MRLLGDREATRESAEPRTVEVRQIDDYTFVVRSAADGDTATRISVADGKVVAMKQFATDPER